MPQLHPSLDPAAVARLQAALADADYTADAVLEAIGEAGQAALERNHSLASERALAGRDDPLATLTRLFVLQLPVAEAAVRKALPVDDLADAGILARATDAAGAPQMWRATLDIRPYSSPDDGATGWLVSDHAATLDTARGAPRPDHVLGVSGASTSLTHLMPQTPLNRALDLGTGCGVQTLHLARHAQQVVATDLNPRAVALARLTCGLSNVTADVRLGSLYEPVADELFDLIVTNPPFVMSPPSRSELTYRESTHAADGLVRTVVAEGVSRLSDGGLLQVLGNWAHVRGQPWHDRLAGWVSEPDADLLVIEREVLDPYQYIEIWLADAGLAGTPSYRSRYDEWLDYFEAEQIEAVGMGWITVRRGGTGLRHLETWPHPVQQPIGPTLVAMLAAAELRTMSDAQVLDIRWVLDPTVAQETLGQPGAEDPEHVVLRQRTGMLRAVEVDTALGGVLGACDGELSLGQIIAAVATLLDAPVSDLSAEIVRQVRPLIGECWLTPAP